MTDGSLSSSGFLKANGSLFPFGFLSTPGSLRGYGFLIYFGSLFSIGFLVTVGSSNLVIDPKLTLRVFVSDRQSLKLTPRDIQIR